MEQRTNNILTMLKRITRFFSDNPIALAAVAELMTLIAATITALETSASSQTGGSCGSSGGVGTKQLKYKQLRGYLKDVARVGRSLDPDVIPGIRSIFVLPNSNGYGALVASAQSMIDEATLHEATFVGHGLPPTFLAELNALVADFNSGEEQKIGGKLKQVSGTSGLIYRARKGLEAAQKLNAIARAYFRNDPIKLAMWAHARHIQAAPEREAQSAQSPSSPAAAESSAS